jgi:cation diffusion facilitator family transporter
MMAKTRTIAAAASDYVVKRRVTLVGAGVNLVLAAGKVIFGIIGQSQALVADGVHSLSDLVSDAFVLVAARFGSHGPDLKHPYGHGRFETMATVAIGLLLLAVAVGFIYDAATRLLDPGRLLVPGWLALGAAVVSVAAKETLYQYTVAVGLKVRSRLIEANAWHHRSDALSSVVVIVGVVGAMAGVTWLDAGAAIIVAVMVAIVGLRFVWNGLKEFVDTGIDPEAHIRLRAVIDSVNGIRSHHMLRTRRIGNDVLVDLHIVVDPDLTASEAHRVAEVVRDRLLEHVDDASEVLVHVDVE